MWTSCFWFKPALAWPIAGDLHRVVDQALLGAGLPPLARWVAKSALFTLLPVLVLRLARRDALALAGRPRARRGAFLWVSAAYAASLPFLLWLSYRPGMHAFYLRMFRDGVTAPVLANLAALVLEHLWIFGALLQLALPPGSRSDERDIGIRERLRSALPATVAVSLVFGAVHAGKDFGEILTAFPGGLGLALLTWWTGSLWPGVVLHAATSLTILVGILMIAG